MVFTFERSEREGTTMLSLAGNLDAATAHTLKAEVVAIAEAKKQRIIVDLAKLTLIDSTGVGVLISLFKRTRAIGGQVFFAALEGQPREIFRLLRLDRSLDLFPTVEAASDKLKA